MSSMNTVSLKTARWAGHDDEKAIILEFTDGAQMRLTGDRTAMESLRSACVVSLIDDEEMARRTLEAFGR